MAAAVRNNPDYMVHSARNHPLGPFIDPSTCSFLFIIDNVAHKMMKMIVKCNFPMDTHVHLLVVWLVCLSVGLSV